MPRSHITNDRSCTNTHSSKLIFFIADISKLLIDASRLFTYSSKSTKALYIPEIIDVKQFIVHECWCTNGRLSNVTPALRNTYA